MLKGEIVGIVVLEFVSTGSWCYLSYAYVNPMMMSDECLVVAVLNWLVLLVGIDVNLVVA